MKKNGTETRAILLTCQKRLNELALNLNGDVAQDIGVQ
jgi:hypothetical protein